MKKIIITLIAILCMTSLVSCKKEIATEKDVEELLEKLLENTFSEQTYSCYYSIKIEDNTDISYYTENLKKINVKGYAKVTNDFTTKINSIDFMQDGKYVSKDYSRGSNVTSKESIVVFNYNEKKYEEVYFYQKHKEVEKQTKNSSKGYVKYQMYDSSMVLQNASFKDIINDVFDLKYTLNKLKYSSNDRLVYISKNHCKIITNDDLGTYTYNLKIKGNELKKVEITFSSPTKKSEVLIDLTKKVNIKKPKDYKKYLEG